MSEALEIVEDAVPQRRRRVGLADLNLHWSWLAPRLTARYRHLDETQIRRVLVGAMADNDALFMCDDRSIGLTMICRKPLEAEQAHEIFVLGRDPVGEDDLGCEAAEWLYDEIGRWARQMRVSEVVFDYFSDVNHWASRKRMGGHTAARSARVCQLDHGDDLM